MFTRISLWFVVLMSISVRVVPAQDLTLEEVLKKNEEALGGAEALGKVQTLKLTARTAVNGMEMEMTTSLKRPNMVRTEAVISGSLASTGFDGNAAWMVNPSAGVNEPQKLEDLSSFANSKVENSLSHLAAMKASGYSIELQGKENVNGTPSYKLKVVPKSGTESTYFLDAGTFLPSKVISRVPIMGQEMTGESYPGDYKKVSGIMFAHKVDMSINGISMQVTYDKVEVNLPLDDSLFKTPRK
jgi:outer membrane lipoprotein-sorting protein